MNTEHSFWSRLASMPSGTALLADWQSVFGPEFPQLKLTARQARSFPCPEQPPCECRHVVRETDDAFFASTSSPSPPPREERAGERRPFARSILDPAVVDERTPLSREPSPQFVAVCTCCPCECDPFPIQPKDLMLYALDRDELGKAICHTLGFAPLDGSVYSTPAIREIGSYGPMRAPVYLATAQHSLLLIELQKLFTARPAPFILLTPTPCAAETISALQRHSCARLSLSGVLQISPLSPSSPLSPFTSVCPPGLLHDLLAPFTAHPAAERGNDQALQEIHRDLSSLRHQLRQLPAPARNDPIPEDTARHAFALLQKLDAESSMKAPNLLTVFRLYCMEEMTTARIARKCACSRSTILGRLRLIRQKTGVDPEALRRLSPHLEKIERDIADSRAEHIHRKSLIYDDPDNEE